MQTTATDTFWETLRTAVAEATFVKLTLSKPVQRQQEWRNVFVRPIDLQGQSQLSFTLRYSRRDETKNFEPMAGVEQLQAWVPADFLSADLFTTDQHLSLQYNKRRKAHLRTAEARHTDTPPLVHNRQKNRLIAAEGQPYLTALGIAGADGQILKSGQRKYRQINKYIEIIDQLLQAQPLPPEAHILDMGSGKGYLTFALYDYLQRGLGLSVQVTGVELRPDLVAFCNEVAQKSGFTQLQFVCGSIGDYTHAGRVDMLIALHACDTATDESLAQGIRAQAQVMVVAPCCQKQVRRAMQPPPTLQPILQHGILLERQAELLTDGLRALLLEGHGYRTRVFEFIGTEHTPKNVMITAQRDQPRPEALAEVAELKRLYGIGHHQLETLLTDIPATD